jgi:hypothetical protein
MKQTVNFNDFVDAFRRAGRENQFTYDALERIFEWIEQNEQDEGREWELDVVALCCELVEMSLDEVVSSYNIELDFEANIYSQVVDYIGDNSTYIGDTKEETFVFVQF